MEIRPIQTPAGRWMSAAPVSAAFAFALAASLHTIWQPAFWQHLAAGREIASSGAVGAHGAGLAAAAGAVWTNTEWLADWLLYLLWQAGGAPLVVLLSATALSGAFALLWRMAGRIGGAAAAAAALVLCIWLLMPVHDAMPVLFTAPLAALFIRTLDRPRATWSDWAWLAPAQVAWINLHPLGLLGPVLAAGAALAAAFEGETRDEARRSALRRGALALGLLALTAVNPHGFGLHSFVAQHPTVLGGQEALIWISPVAGRYAPSLHSALLTVTLLLGACGIILPKHRLPWWPAIAAAAGALLLLWSAAFVTMFVVLGFSFLALSVRALAVALQESAARALRYTRPAPAWAAALPVLIAALVSALAVGTGAWHRRVGSFAQPGLGAPAADLPSTAMTVLQRPDFPDRFVNLPVDGDYIAWARPGRPVFIDSRAGLYPPELAPLLRKAVAGDRAALDEVDRRWSPDAFVVNCLAPNAAAGVAQLRSMPSWEMVYFDGVTAILMRRQPSTAGWFGNPEIQHAGTRALSDEADGYAAALDRGAHPPPPPALIGAALVFDAIGRPNAAADAFALLVRGAPAMHSALLHLGSCRVRCRQPAQAIEPLTRFTRLEPKHPQGWHWLAEAFRATGRPEEAQAAAARETALQAAGRR